MMWLNIDRVRYGGSGISWIPSAMNDPVDTAVPKGGIIWEMDC